MLLIADEPTTALDVTIESQILELIKSLKYGDKPDIYDKPSSTLLITHNFGAVAEIADHIAVMYAGHIVENGSVFSVFDSPLHPYTKLLMQSLPGIRKTEGRLASIPGTVPKFMGKSYKGCRFASRCPEAEESCFVLKPELKEISKGHSCACFKVGKRI
jgi:oligopeptide/dipeptide ABC transporter ATP-binding protein